MFPSSNMAFVVLDSLQKIPLQYILVAAWGKVKSNVVTYSIYFLPVKNEWCFGIIMYWWNTEEALANIYPGMPWIHNGSITGIVVGVSKYWIWLCQSNFIEIAC